MKIEHTSDLLHSVLCDCGGQLTLFLVTTLSNIKSIYLHQTTLQGPVISAVPSTDSTSWNHGLLSQHILYGGTWGYCQDMVQGTSVNTVSTC